MAEGIPPPLLPLHHPHTYATAFFLSPAPLPAGLLFQLRLPDLDSLKGGEQKTKVSIRETCIHTAKKLHGGENSCEKEKHEELCVDDTP